jgi:membrane protein implicated in regulation of membrane protease activity
MIPRRWINPAGLQNGSLGKEIRMASLFSEMHGLEIFFVICAVVGGVFVGIKLVLQFMGADGELETDLDGQHPDSDIGFKLLSFHGLTSFLMMFGLVGLALYRQNRAGTLIAMAGAVAAGLASVWIIGRIFGFASRLQSSGTLKTAAAVGSTGTVYLTIPAGGIGRVTISFQGRLREFDASAVNGLDLATGTPIRVIRVEANILVVEKIQ